MKRPLGCLSGVGLIAALLALLVVGGIVAATGGAIFSPGRLNAQGDGETFGGVASHAETGGDCAACHAAPWSTEDMADRCAACHTAMRDPTTHLAQFHALLWDESAAQPCRSCHPEHRGATADLTEMTVTDFPHERTGFSLAVHQERRSGEAFACVDCHTDNLTAFAVSTCDTCHTQLDAAYATAHREDFGAQCLDCHDGTDRFSGFDHSRAAFPLAGAHAVVRCGECHTAAAPADFAAAPTDCIGCHQEDDAHDGQFGTDCAGCHAPDDWGNATFDHAQTAFPLTGAHRQVRCEQCHVGSRFEGTSTACAGCHEEPAFHRGLFAQGCDACHATTAWLPAPFDLAHTFPINHGEGGANACRTCHPDALTAYTCYSCHEHDPAEMQEEHADEGISDIANCARCHPTGDKDEAERDDD